MRETVSSWSKPIDCKAPSLGAARADTTFSLLAVLSLFCVGCAMVQRIAFICVLLLGASLRPCAGETIEFRDGDRIVFIGNTFIERAQSYGHLETWLTTALADRKLTFRNLGWSGDTVFGHARSYFGPPQEGFERLTKHLAEIEPTLIISAYGAVAAFEGEAGLESFVNGYQRLVGMFKESGARVVLMSPPPAENLPAPLPNQDAHNERLALYRDAIKTLAAKQQCGFADVFGILRETWPNLPHPLTDNGLHFTDEGYAAITPYLAQALGIHVSPKKVALDAPSGKAEAEGVDLEALASGPSAVTLRIHPLDASPVPLALTIRGLEDKTFAFRSARPLAKVSAEAMEAGVTLSPLQWNSRLTRLRSAILKKNELFFHRWRPQNETYLFGFRKHEQGNNAVEIPQFEPLIAEQESLIEHLKTAEPFTLTLTP